MAYVWVQLTRFFVFLLICLIPDSSRAISLRLEAGDAAPGELSVISSVLDPEGDSVAGLAATIRFDSDAFAVLRNDDDRPDCNVAGDLDAQFVFRPDFCSGECNEVKATILSLNDLRPIEAGLLYTCNIRVGSQTRSGKYSLELVDAEASDAFANLLPVNSFDGTIAVLEPPGATRVPTPSPSPIVDTPTPGNASDNSPTPFPAEDDGCVVGGHPKPRASTWLTWLTCLAFVGARLHRSSVKRRRV